MKSSLVALAVIASGLTSAQAADLKVLSQIDAVTVYPEGADIARLIDVGVPARETTLVLDDLPGSVDPQSIRIDGTSSNDLEILSVDTKLVSDFDANKDEQRLKLAAQLETLADERASLDQLLSDKDAERRLLLSLAERPLATEANAVKALDVASLDNLIGSVAARLSATSKVIQDARIRQRAIDKSMGELNAKISELAPESKQHLQVQVHVNASGETKSKLKLTYRVAEAGWRAFYDAKLNMNLAGEDSKLTLVRRAEVTQATGEAWNNVALTLSTAQPSGSAEAPVLDESEVSIAVPPAPAASAEAPVANGLVDKFKGDNGRADFELDAPRGEPVRQRQAEVQVAGFDAQYVISDRVSIDNAGTSKKVRISTDDLSAKLQVEAVPRLDATAYLTAKFTVKAEAAMLAGPVNLFRDGTYVGQTSIAELSSGEDAKLGFGADDLVRVKRSEVKRLAAEEGIISSSATQEMGWVISIINLHKTKMPIRVIDRKPFSSDEKITVTDRSDNTPATVRDLDKKRGVLAWDLDLEPGARSEIKTGYKVSAPKDINVSSND